MNMLLLLLALFAAQQKNPGLNTQSDDPTFTMSNPVGWTPTCPAPNTKMVRKDVQPNCIWGTVEMVHKPTEGQFKCVPKKEYKKLKQCGVDPYFSAGIGIH